MKRKVIKQGHNTLTMTLPSNWVRRFNLKQGNEINIVERDNGLFISTEKNKEDKSTEIDISNLDIPTIWKFFMAVYREGYNEIRVKYNKNSRLKNPYKYLNKIKQNKKGKYKIETYSILEFIHEIVNRFIGFEIFSHDSNYIIIKDMSEISAREFDTSLRRVFLLLQQMADDTLEALKSSNPDIVKHIYDVDINLDKFHDYCIRVLNSVGNLNTKQSTLLFSILFILELTGDEYKTISSHIIYDYKNADFHRVIEIAETIKKQFNLFYDLFYNFSQEKVVEISNIDKSRFFDVENMHARIKTNEEKEIFHHLRIIARYINALTELRIEMEF